MKIKAKQKQANNKILMYYKGIIIFVIPVFLFIIVASVVVRNKPEAMRTTLITSALANLIVIGFITNTFISLGIDYIKFKKETDWSKGHKKQVYIIIGKNTLFGVFNFFYLLLIAYICTDLTHWLSSTLFTSGDFTWAIDWWGVLLAVVLCIVVSIFAALLLSQFIKSELVYGMIGLIYFLGFGYLAGGMFGPGATQWMLWPSLFMPHAYIAHFLGGALTDGHYVIPHLPSGYDIITQGRGSEIDFGNLNWDSVKILLDNVGNIINHDSDFMKSIYVQQNSSIWDMSIMNPWEFVGLDGAKFNDDVSLTNPKIYNSFYQINALNIFVPLGTAIASGSVWGYLFYVLK